MALTSGLAPMTATLRANPTLTFTAIPAVGSSDPLQGVVQGVAPADYRVAVFINVFGWWTKPTWAEPLTLIGADGTWTCAINTGGADACASEVAAFVVPAAYQPPLLGGQSQIPAELSRNAIAQAMATRTLPSRVLHFAGLDWAVKDTVNCSWGPGPNYFSSSPENAWVDATDRLHLKLTHRADRWVCAEVALQQPLGYGTYQFTLDTAVDQFDPNVVFALFTWSDDPAAHHRELDIEFSRWSAANNPNNAQFVVQPFDRPGHLFPFRQPAGVPQSTQLIDWQPERVAFRSLRGYPPVTSQIARLIKEGEFTNRVDIPLPGDATPHINLWLFNGVPPGDGQEVEVIVHSFQFTPAAPNLQILSQNARVLLSWPVGYSGFTGERAPLPTGPWSALTGGSEVDGDRFQMQLPSTGAGGFFRLKRPTP